LVLVKSATDLQPPQIKEELSDSRKDGTVNLSRGDTYEK
jgi:hypothetical protein